MFNPSVSWAAAAAEADAASSQQGSWASVPDAAVREAFLGCSQEARQTLEVLQVSGACRMGACLWRLTGGGATGLNSRPLPPSTCSSPWGSTACGRTCPWCWRGRRGGRSAAPTPPPSCAALRLMPAAPSAGPSFSAAGGRCSSWAAPLALEHTLLLGSRGSGRACGRRSSRRRRRRPARWVLTRHMPAASSAQLCCFHRLHNLTLQPDLCPSRPPPLQPPTAQQEVGWHHAAAPLLVRERCEAPGARYLPLRSTDVTRGIGEGSSGQTYFGMYL